MKVLIDTTAIIYLLKGDKLILDKIQELKPDALFYTTVLNVYEVIRGIKSSERNKESRLHALDVFTSSINILPIDLETVKRAAEIYADLRKKGITIDENDYLIMGACISDGIDTIITKNEKHFKIEGLKVITH